MFIVLSFRTSSLTRLDSFELVGKNAFQNSTELQMPQEQGLCNVLLTVHDMTFPTKVGVPYTNHMNECNIEGGQLALC